jgi:hypothetical protein
MDILVSLLGLEESSTVEATALAVIAAISTKPVLTPKGMMTPAIPAWDVTAVPTRKVRASAVSAGVPTPENTEAPCGWALAVPVVENELVAEETATPITLTVALVLPKAVAVPQAAVVDAPVSPITAVPDLAGEPQAETAPAPAM